MPAATLSPAKLLPLIRAGIAAAPHRADLKLQLAKILFQTGAAAEIVERFDAAAARGSDLELSYYVGLAALAVRDDRLAHDALRNAADNGHEAAFGHLAEALRNLGQPDAALTAGLRGLARAPSDYKALGIVVRTLLERGERDRIWALCAELRARGGWGASLPSAMALAASTPEQRATVAALVDVPRWLAATPLDVPQGFNRRLAAELLAHDSLAPLPATKATTGAGRRIDHLQRTAGPLARDLLARIEAAVADYVERRQSAVDHPMFQRPPAARVLNSWALTIHDDGHEDWHMHPSAWISGVYYVAVPNAGARSNARAGQITFGSFPFGAESADPAWPRRHVTPREGLLLIFPSYFAHRTWPTGVADPRICVAFDVGAAPPNDG
jgi:uncharacterized protein (TIGR02466 family)